MPKKAAGPDFEKSLAELESLVQRMEQGELSLEESLKQFERGVALVRTCQQSLNDAEQRVKLLLNKDGVESLAPFASNAVTPTDVDPDSDEDEDED